MTTATRNEAAERLRDHLTADGLHYELDAALAAERRATVERIRERLVLHNEVGCTDVLWPSEVVAILDEEAAR